METPTMLLYDDQAKSLTERSECGFTVFPSIIWMGMDALITEKKQSYPQVYIIRRKIAKMKT